MATNGTEAETCAVCGRGILKGERTYEYATPAGDVRDVCALCRPAAEQAGWVPPDRLESVRAPRRERRRGWRPALNERFQREVARSRERASRAARRAERVVAAPDRPAPDPPPRQRPRPENGVAAGLAEFNEGESPRMIAGLCRSLGEPKAEVRPTVDGDGILVTVAWELSWYSWEVTHAGARIVAKGDEVSERPGPEPVWNAQVGDDGRLTVVGPT